MFYDLKDIVDLTGVVVKPRTLAERSPIQASAGLAFVVASCEQILFPCFHVAHEGLISHSHSPW